MLDTRTEQIIRTARKFAGETRLSPEDREDLEQDIAVALLKAERRYDPSKATWSTYAFMVAKRAVQDYFRHQPHDGRRYRRGSGEIVYFKPEEDAPISEYLDDLSLLEIKELLLKLKPQYRTVLFCLIYGLSTQQTAEILNTSPNMVWWMRSELRSSLRNES